jgi:hypothetical protein
MPRRLVIKLTHRVLPWGLTQVRCKRMRWRWTSIYFPRRRRTRFSTREEGMLIGPRLRLIGRPKGPRTRQKGMPRKVGDHGSQRRWLPPLLHLCCHRFPLHHNHRIPASKIPPVHSSHCQDFSISHYRPSWTLQGELCMYRSSSVHQCILCATPGLLQGMGGYEGLS